MTISEQVIGDITKLRHANVSDVIIGMNTEFNEFPQLDQIVWGDIKKPVSLRRGSVLSLQMDSKRDLHMMFCHQPGVDGWEDSHKYIRLGMDYLWATNSKNRYFSMVRIGTGKVGSRDGADWACIKEAICDSYLSVELFNHKSPRPVDISLLASHQKLIANRLWQPY